MKVYGINGSPRSSGNTSALLKAFLDGAASVPGTETEMVNLYDYKFQGCHECFACKLDNDKVYGRCCYSDDIKDLLWNVANSDVIAFGSPIFFFDISGQLRCFLERLMYPFTAFKKDADRVIAPKKIRTMCIYTSNAPMEKAEANDYSGKTSVTRFWLKHVFGYEPETLFSANILQYEDYDRYRCDIWDYEEKKKYRSEQFPKDMEKAYEQGRKLALEALNDTDK